MRFIFIVSLFFISIAQAQMLQNQDFKSVADLQAQGLTLTQAKESVLHDTKIYVTSVAKTLAEAIADGDISGGGAGTGTLNLLEDPGFENSATEGVVSGGTQSLNASTILATPNNTNSLELNFNNVTGNYILEKNTSAQFDGVQGLVSVWIKNAKSGVKLIPRINGADSTALSVDVKTDNKWNEYVIPAVIGTTSFGLKIDVTASNAGSLFIDEATVGAMPATMTPEVAQAEYFGGLIAQGAAGCIWASTSTSFANFAADSDCNEFTEIGNIKKPSTKIPGLIIPAGSPSGTYKVIPSFFTFKGSPSDYACRFRLSDGASTSSTTLTNYIESTTRVGGHLNTSWSYSYQSTNTDVVIQLQGLSSLSGNECRLPFDSVGSKLGFDVYYYPPKNKIYSNKSMGWYVDVNIGGANPSLGTSSVSTYTSISNASLDMVINPGSQPAQIPCSGTNPSTGITCSAGDEQIGVVFDVPSVGTYEVCASFTQFVRLAGTGDSGVQTTFQLVETPNNSQSILQEGNERGLAQFRIADSSSDPRLMNPRTSCGVFKFNSVGEKTVRLMFEQLIQAAPPASSEIRANRDVQTGQNDIHITVKPFINNEQITASFKQIDDAIQAIPNQNYVINGNFDFWQRGTSAVGGDLYRADRFFSSSGTEAYLQGTATAPSGSRFYAITSRTTASPAVLGINHRFESSTAHLLLGKTVTLSFLARQTAGTLLPIQLRVFAANAVDNFLGITQLIGPEALGSMSGSWQKFTYSFTVTSAMLNGFQLNIINTNAGTATFNFAQVKLEEGSVATPFVLAGGTIQGELAACQRYYEKSYNINVAPASVTNTGAFALTGVGVGNRPFVTTSFKQTKRASLVAVTFYNPRTGLTTNPIWDTNTASTDYSVVTQVPSETGFYFAPGGTLPASASAVVHWTADAEL